MANLSQRKTRLPSPQCSYGPRPLYVSRHSLTRSDTELTGTVPEPAGSTLAGTTHLLELRTAYYKADVPVWLDLISSSSSSSSSSSINGGGGDGGGGDGNGDGDGDGGDDDDGNKGSPPSENDEDGDAEGRRKGGGGGGGGGGGEVWASAFLAPEARDVLDALGGLVAVFSIDERGPEHGQEQEQLLAHVGRVVRDGLGGFGWDGVGLAVGLAPARLSEDDMDRWNDACADAGLEFVLVAPGADEPNEFGGESTSLLLLLACYISPVAS